MLTGKPELFVKLHFGIAYAAVPPTCCSLQPLNMTARHMASLLRACHSAWIIIKICNLTLKHAHIRHGSFLLLLLFAFGACHCRCHFKLCMRVSERPGALPR